MKEEIIDNKKNCNLEMLIKQENKRITRYIILIIINIALLIFAPYFSFFL